MGQTLEEGKSCFLDFPIFSLFWAYFDIFEVNKLILDMAYMGALESCIQVGFENKKSKVI